MPLVGQPFHKDNSNPEEDTFHWPFIDSELPTEIATVSNQFDGNDVISKYFKI